MTHASTVFVIYLWLSKCKFWMILWVAVIMYYDTGLMNSQSVPGMSWILLCAFTHICTADGIRTYRKGGPRMSPTSSPNCNRNGWQVPRERPWTSCASSRRRTAWGPCTCACDAGSTDLAGCLRWRRSLQEARLTRLCGSEFKVRVHEISKLLRLISLISIATIFFYCLITLYYLNYTSYFELF